MDCTKSMQRIGLVSAVKQKKPGTLWEECLSFASSTKIGLVWVIGKKLYGRAKQKWTDSNVMESSIFGSGWEKPFKAVMWSREWSMVEEATWWYICTVAIINGGGLPQLLQTNIFDFIDKCSYPAKQIIF